MSKHQVNKHVKCPCYKHEDAQVIYCNGVIPASTTHVAFADRRTALRYKEALCRTGRHVECPVFRMLEELGGGNQ